MYKIKLTAIPIFVFFVFAFGASADTLGQGQRFFISPQYDVQSSALVNATLRHVSDRAYFYVADDYWGGLNTATRGQVIDQIKLLAQEFDSRIYTIETEFFGSEPNPGIDGDSRITILLTPLIKNAGGYYDTANQYQVAEAINSNQREMIYLNVNEIMGLNKIFAFLAHEFQHLISFNQKENLRRVSDDIWLNELRSEYAVTLLGYNNVFEGSHLERRVNALRENPEDSLTEWKNFPADYGQIGLFGEYLAGHWSPQVIADTLKNNLAGISSINESLARNGLTDTFIDIFRSWLIANTLNSTTVDSKFGYTRNELNDLRITPAKVLTALGDNGVLTISDLIKDWQGKWYEISQFVEGQNGVLKITFDSPSLASFHISYIVFKTDGKPAQIFGQAPSAQESKSPKTWAGKPEIYSFDPTPASNTVYVSGIGADVDKIVVMPIKKDKLSGFSSNETPIQLTTTFERITSLPENVILSTSVPFSTSAPNTLLTSDTQPATSNQQPATSLPDGSLIRAENDYKVYVINGNWRRHIISQEIFKFYPHLGFDKVRVVSPSVLAGYQESNLIRYVADQKVYAVSESGIRQWLNVTAEQFTASGRNWDAIFLVNDRELNFYRSGSDILN